MIPLPLLPSGPAQPAVPPDPSRPASGQLTLFDLETPLASARAVAIPVPYEATVSGEGGCADGPRSLIAASMHVDLADESAGDAWRQGIAALPESSAIRRLGAEVREVVRAARQGSDASGHGRIDRAGESVWSWLDTVVGRLFEAERIPFVLGGEHAVSVGAFRAAGRRHDGIGILQIDAHADLRAAYEGFRTSHASVMKRALETDGIAGLVQVGLRDESPEDRRTRASAGERVVAFSDRMLARAVHRGETVTSVIDGIIDHLPRDVWISLDVDGLDPSLCPTTGTPVPGGLSWRELIELVVAVPDSGRRVVGADIVEIGPGRYDGFVAAKALYLLAGAAGGTSTR